MLFAQLCHLEDYVKLVYKSTIGQMIGFQALILNKKFTLSANPRVSRDMSRKDFIFSVISDIYDLPN